MIWFYRLLYLPGLFISLPFYILRMWRRGGYRKNFEHRLGRFHRLPPVASGKKRIWLQAVSVGEILAVGPFIEALQSKGTVEIVLTTTTSTGYAEAVKRYESKVYRIGIFPLDFWLCNRTAWKRIQPDAVILTESELWPEHLHRARKSDTPAYLINARISDRSYKRYKQVPAIARRMLKKFRAIYAASDLDRSRLIELGSPNPQVKSTGSIKFDVKVGSLLTDEERRQLRKELGFESDNEDPFVLLGSSTWPGEEEALLLVQNKLIEAKIDCRLLLAPRHAERGPEIRRLLERQSLSWHQRSSGKEAPSQLSIHLADTTGELTGLSQAADLAFIGKSLEPNIGGQTPIEAAGLGIPILMGPNMNNFRDVARSLVAAGAAKQIDGVDSLLEQSLHLAKDATTRREIREAGLDWHKQNRGSSQRIADEILSQLF